MKKIGISVATISMLSASGYFGYRILDSDSLTIDSKAISSITISPDDNASINMALSDLTVALNTLQVSMQAMQRQQAEIVKENNTLSKKLTALADDYQIISAQAVDTNNESNDVYASSQPRQLSEEVSTAQFDAYFDEKWQRNTYEGVDDSWTGQLESVFNDIQSSMPEEIGLSSSVTNIACGVSSCSVEFTHTSGASDDEKIAYLSEMNLPYDSEVVYKHVEQNGELINTYAVFTRL